MRATDFRATESTEGTGFHEPWSWWCRQMETFSALLAICAGNSSVTGEFLTLSPVRRGALMFSLIYASINGWVNNREAGDLRRYCAHHDVTVVITKWHGNAFRINAFLREATPHKGPVTRSFNVFFDESLTSYWTNSRVADGLRCLNILTPMGCHCNDIDPQCMDL